MVEYKGDLVPLFLIYNNFILTLKLFIMDKKTLLELRRELLDKVDDRTSTKEDLVAIIEEVSKKMHQLYLQEAMESNSGE